MLMHRALQALALALVLSSSASAQQSSSENPRKTCEMSIADEGVADQCRNVFPLSAPCCVQYDEKRLAGICAAFSSVRSALICYTQMFEIGLMKTELLDEARPGLAAESAALWVTNSLRICAAEKSKKAAISCARRQKSSTISEFREQNAMLRRSDMNNDPIVTTCRQLYGSYWVGVERCVADQRAAKRRLGL